MAKTEADDATTAEDKNEDAISNANDDELRDMGLPPKFTLDGLKSFLTKEEIDRLNEDGDSVYDSSATSPEDEDDEDDPDADNEDDEDDPDANGEDEDDPDASGEDDQSDALELDMPDDMAKIAEPQLPQADFEGLKSAVEASRKELSDLREAYEDGDLTDEEYAEKEEELHDKIADARLAVKESERDTQRAQESYAEAWYAKVDAFTRANNAFASQEPIAQLGNRSAIEVFDEALKEINKHPGYANMSMDQRIQMGARIANAFVLQETGKGLTGKPAKPAKADKKATAEDRVRQQGKRPDAPSTLGDVPTASDTTASNGLFEAADRATGLDGEAAYASMTPQQREAWLRGA
ncbi:hypothetical protein BMI86_10260 [Thioclava sp. DLFJ5-1]|uniref:hypothetical protein n=1 Tax=Thioclava sp. DLFJ5-1 TaxID=1915314 RepID=UPI00099867F9|nr:hypothetical protein [Thioclava sp. DLFJ5-1]OOY20880.1 hypothetical protein BMI86_10260 [Thioclava sp. DLFJ5-1]